MSWKPARQEHVRGRDLTEAHLARLQPIGEVGLVALRRGGVVRRLQDRQVGPTLPHPSLECRGAEGHLARRLRSGQLRLELDQDLLDLRRAVGPLGHGDQRVEHVHLLDGVREDLRVPVEVVAEPRRAALLATHTDEVLAHRRRT